jgi:two-component system response regulator YesN
MMVLETHEGWSRPDINMTVLSEEVFSNRTYVNEAFRRNVGTTFGEYLIRRRIDFVVGEMKRNTDSNIQYLFQRAGYRQRTTAWKNFHKIMGMSPSEFQATLK